MKRIPRLLAWGLLPLSTCLGAAQVSQFTPQGEVSQQQRVSVVFSGDMVALGSTAAPAPFAIQCPASGKASSAWSDARTWVYTLERPLAAGEQCRFILKPGLKTLKGEAVKGQREFAFKASGFRIESSWPMPDESVDEDQIFVLFPSQPVQPATLEGKLWCESSAVGQRIPVRMVDAKTQQSLERSFKDQFERPLAEALVFQCLDRLAPSSKVQIVWSKDMRSAAGQPSRQEERLSYLVREPLRATFSCERASPQAPCSPLSPVRVQLSHEVPATTLLKARIRGPRQEFKPVDPFAQGGPVQALLGGLQFSGPFPENTDLVLELPSDLQDESGRSLSNASQFPLRFKMGGMPPLAKFPGDFGVLELREGGILPITLRQVEALLPVNSQQVLNTGLQHQKMSDDKRVLATLNALAQFEKQSKERRFQRNGEWVESTDYLYPRELSFLQGQAGVSPISLPKPGPRQDTEVLGIPLAKPGFYVLELKSEWLGAALLEKPAPMYVRATALVTNLSVHFKKGRNSGVVWVTTLDKGQAVPGAQVQVSTCAGELLWKGVTDAQGRAEIKQSLKESSCEAGQFTFASARLGEDYSFVRTDWNQGIEAWRFGISSWGELSRFNVHTITDRTLFKQGDTLHMKHIARSRSAQGFVYPKAEDLPTSMRIYHLDEGTEYTLPLRWDQAGSATTDWKIPAQAKLGRYYADYQGGRRGSTFALEFKVSDFRLPVFTGHVRPAAALKAGQKDIPLEVSLSYLNGGVAKNQAVTVSSELRARWVNFPDHSEFNFDMYADEEFLKAYRLPPSHAENSLVMNQAPLQLNDKGLGQISVPLQVAPLSAKDLYTEATFTDPNGEVQTLRGTATLWPSKVLVGIHRELGKRSLTGNPRVQLLAVNTQGKPKAGQHIDVFAHQRIDYSHRRRVVGGFYAYESRSEYKDQGKVCSGTTDERGLMWCELHGNPQGALVLLAQAEDEQGKVARAISDFNLGSLGGDDWMAVGSQDRMDVLSLKSEYKAGDVARFEVRTPFAEALALVTVETDDILDTRVLPLSRFKPWVEIPIQAEWGPNAVVSVLAVRGRVEPLTWRTFFQWGWREPLVWLRQWWSPEQATAMVDLAKPAFRLGMSSIKIGTEAFRLQVSVSPDKPRYAVRDTVRVTLDVKDPAGRPLPAGSEVALAVVDQALLELKPNDTWGLHEAMMQSLPHEVETSTSQLQVVGKRHYGKKAVAAGGGGGRAPARELFDTLVAWKPSVKLDAKGRAVVEFQANDSLSAFQLVAVATAGPGLFGTGMAAYQTRQDLQVISGLPPLVRENDQISALFTLRNTTARNMQVQVVPTVDGKNLEAQTVSLKPNDAQEVSWSVTVPQGQSTLQWRVAATEKGTAPANAQASDTLMLNQTVRPETPITTVQASSQRLTGRQELVVQMPANALPKRGGLEVQLSATQASTPVAVKSFFESYPYSCLEQKASKAVGLQDAQAWSKFLQELPAHQDSKGLLRYFPGEGPGDATLSAYVLNLGVLAQRLYGFEWPVKIQQSLQSGLIAVVEGRQGSLGWSPQPDALPRTLIALEALTRSGAKPLAAVNALNPDVAALPTSSLVDWYSILRRLPAITGQAQKLTAVQQALRNRLSYSGSRLLFSTESRENQWWLMSTGDQTAFRLLEAVLGDPAWKEDTPKLLQGALQRQHKGHWQTTTANVWASVTLDSFARLEEKTPVTGLSRLRLGQSEFAHTWPATPTNPAAPKPVGLLPWEGLKPGQNATLLLQHEGTGKPWVNVQVQAAMPVKEAQSFGYALRKTYTPMQTRVPGKVSRGDIWQVSLELDARQTMSWVALTDPIPAGARVLGEGDGRDSELMTTSTGDVNQAQGVSPTYVERSQEAYRAYFSLLPAGKHTLTYTFRFNNAGQLGVPATRVEAMYSPDVYGSIPNRPIAVQP